MKIAVVGLGKIGLPLAVFYSKNGHRVFGIDINHVTVELVNRGISPFPNEKDLDAQLLEVTQAGNFTAASSYEEGITNADAIVVVVPVLLDSVGAPDLSNMINATTEIAKYVRKHALICFETTLPVGTTRQKLYPLLMHNVNFGDLHPYHVVFSPERVLSGRIFDDLQTYPKIVGGVFQCCSDLARHFYQDVLSVKDSPHGNGSVEVWQVRDADTAEFVKLAEAIYRDVNIGLANEFSRYADKRGIDVYEVIRAANSQHYSHIHEPGISVGGHCIPVYPHFYISDNPSSEIVVSARKANLMSPAYAIKLLEKEQETLVGKKILIFGLTYRPNVKESTLSGALTLSELLIRKGARVSVYDRLFSQEEMLALGLDIFDGDSETIDAIIIHTPSEEIEIFLSNFQTSKLILDGRNCLSKDFKRDRRVITPGDLSPRTAD